MTNWLDKYRPSKLSEVLGDKSQIQKIDRFVKQFTLKKIDPDKIINPNLIITGTNGIGKTLITNIVIQENNLEKITADLTNISIARKVRRKKTAEKVVEKEVIGPNRSIKTYYMSLYSNRNFTPDGQYVGKKIVLVFDDVSNISNPKEKEAIKCLVKMNNKLKKFPIIIIANTKHSKTVNDLRRLATSSSSKKLSKGKKENFKVINEVLLRPPSYTEIESFVKKVCEKEKLQLVRKKSDVDNIYSEIVEHSQYDVRRLINILEELKMIFEDDDVTLEKFEKYRETSKIKDLDPGIYEATKMLLNQYTDIESILALYGEDRATIPLMVHENYPLNIRQQYPKISDTEQIDIFYSVSKCISESDKVDGLIYSNQCWNLQSVHGFYSCVMPSYHINQHPNKLRKNESYKYTQDYSKTSIKKINNKVIKKAKENQFLKKVSIYDFLYMAYILKTLLERKDFETFAELMKPYHLLFKDIESLIKIDKIKKSKSTLTGKQKALIKNLLGVDE